MLLLESWFGLPIVQVAETGRDPGFQRLRVRSALQQLEIVIALDRERVAPFESLVHVCGHMTGIREQTEPPAARDEHELAGFARIVRDRIGLHGHAAEVELTMAAERLELRVAPERTGRPQRHPHGRVVSARKRIDALGVIAMLVRHEQRRDVTRLSINGTQTLLNRLTRQAAIDHEQRRPELYEQSIAAAAAAERREAQRHQETLCKLIE